MTITTRTHEFQIGESQSDMVPPVELSDENQTAPRGSREAAHASAKRRRTVDGTLESGEKYFAELAPGVRFAERKFLIHFELDT